uniref:Uncharacterized protein n=1 Tax=Pseudo-nitzschia australis TaxID=44445 RepID=A0A7S4EQV2_9STRA|mmetsp:Transcript_6973/g.14840  ORF Transcript_6973/g.14840 Transcript_6973/m.14840 type:complete len:143 (+) Transcript_6973:228-656(+)|eukprot:CAMPEP_0168179718 /NCGR_PEP_ID=MMETSP0139_2-20121125/10025_1 /TAXON_ID=44445 /ORGANISM="Pseudo-nitzschia australis, Strain 10249 10 AB" /LENGTH=142 /DNA_ID=CAMNT_0008099631 /DNA_START=176 /DNA_END=604 /DNA_ORIENTATION=-
MNELVKNQTESTLYMPSMYDSEEEDEDYFVTDARDENTCSDTQRNDARRRHSRYSLMRCLAWSQGEDDKEDKGPSDSGEEEEDEEMFVIQSNSGGCVSFNSVHSAHIDSIHHSSDNEIRPVHWVQRVASDNKLDSFLLGKKD